MNKYLVYTVSDFRESSIDCIHLLYDSLLQKNDNFDFYIITNNINYNNITLPSDYKIIYDDLDSNYVGWLKYTDKLPDHYQYYFYFDSDILCYENLDNLINAEKNISIVKELEHSMSYKWFNYPFASIDDKCSFNVINGVNAGSFVFKDKNFLKKVIEKKFKADDIDKSSTDHQAMFEQSCFNYTCFDFILNNTYYDISSFVKLHARHEITNQKIYHFCGWQGFMDDKYLRMKDFHEKYIDLLKMKIIENRDLLLDFLPKNLIVAEIGVFRGEFSKKIYEILLPKELHLIDIFEGQMCSGDKDGNNIIWVNLDIEYEKLRNELKVFSNIILHKGISLNILSNFKDEYFDIIYIDADHNYESVKKDLELSFIKIKSGGYLCGHDYGHMFPGVIRAVDEFCKEKNLFIKYLTNDGCPSYCIEINK